MLGQLLQRTLPIAASVIAASLVFYCFYTAVANWTLERLGQLGWDMSQHAIIAMHGLAYGLFFFPPLLGTLVFLVVSRQWELKRIGWGVLTAMLCSVAYPLADVITVLMPSFAKICVQSGGLWALVTTLGFLMLCIHVVNSRASA